MIPFFDDAPTIALPFLTQGVACMPAAQPQRSDLLHIVRYTDNPL
jgi:hypothetical protein